MEKLGGHIPLISHVLVRTAKLPFYCWMLERKERHQNFWSAAWLVREKTDQLNSGETAIHKITSTLT